MQTFARFRKLSANLDKCWHDLKRSGETRTIVDIFFVLETANVYDAKNAKCEKKSKEMPKFRHNLQEC